MTAPADHRAAADHLPAFAAALAERFADSAAVLGLHTADFVIAGHALRLEIAGPDLAAFTSGAFAHLAAMTPTAPALTVRVWDGAAAPLPLGAAERQRFHFDDGRFDLHCDPFGRSSLLDRSHGIAYQWFAGTKDLAHHERAAPLRKVIQGWLQPLGLQMVHAAAVGTGDGGALVVGKSGSGKSTTALSCLRAGLAFVGDDYCLVDDGPTAHSLYGAGKLRADAVAAAPELAPFIINPTRAAGEKAIVLLGGPGAPTLATRLPLRVLLIPRLHAADDTRWTPATMADALRAIAPSTVLQLRQGAGASLAAVSALVRRLPSFTLFLGRDRQRVPDAIASLLAQLADRGPCREPDRAPHRDPAPEPIPG